MSRKIEFIGNPAAFGLRPPHPVAQPGFTLSVSSSRPFRPQPVGNVPRADNADAIPAGAFSVTPAPITMSVYTSPSSIPAASWTTVRATSHTPPTPLTHATNPFVNAEVDSARYLRWLLIKRRNRGERIGILVGFLGALILVLGAAVLKLQPVTVIPGAVLMVSLAGFMMLRRLLRGGVSQDG